MHRPLVFQEVKDDFVWYAATDSKLISQVVKFQESGFCRAVTNYVQETKQARPAVDSWDRYLWPNNTSCSFTAWRSTPSHAIPLLHTAKDKQT